MNKNQNYRQYKIAIASLLIITLIGITVLVVLFINPSKNVFYQYSERDLAQSIEDNDYEKAVKVYNGIIAGNEEKEAKYNPYIDQAIEDIVTAWSSGTIDYDSAKKELTFFKGIDNQNLSTEAKKEVRFITVETKGNASYAEAEKQFEKEATYRS